MKRKYDKMKSDEQRAKFIGTVFKGMDLDTVRGARFMLGGNLLDTFASQSKQISESAPIIGRDLKENTQSASATAARMKATLGQAIDRMATPLNKGFAELGTYMLDDLKLSGEQMLAGGAALGIGSYYAGRGAKTGAGALLNKVMGGPETLKNIAVGKVLEEATGVSSVFVTNWPQSLGNGGLPDLQRRSPSPGKDKTGLIPPWLGPAALGVGASQIGSASGSNTDRDRLNLVSRNKLLNSGQREYQTAFYQNRIDLAAQNPEQSQDWLSSQAQRLTHQQTGMTAAGTSLEGANAWAAGVVGRALEAGAATKAAVERLQGLLGQPLVIEVRTDSRMIMAEVERRTDLQVRRGQ
ncbi:hypothetical protein [Pseudomonas syringae]|uniref:hypothetical protein n=1 Tax=Pseudomonas syringae TaxID=317 RepID=UPI001111F960|nr:hypothetical protein [Pseudomonas syringae]